MLGKLNMKEEQHQFLALVGHPPARLTVEQAAWVLGCQFHDMPILIASRLLKPLGNPPQNAVKFFSTAEVMEMAKDRAWLAKMTQTISQHWHKRNVRQKSHSRSNSENGLPLVLTASGTRDPGSRRSGCLPSLIHRHWHRHDFRLVIFQGGNDYICIL